MAYDVALVELAETPTAVVRGHVAHDGIADLLGLAFGSVAQALAEAGAHPAGPPFATYRMADDGGWDIEAGFPVAAALAPHGSVQPGTLPGGPAAQTVHRGPYEQLAGAYEAVQSWVRDEGRTPDGTPWESYLDGPEVAEPRTVVTQPC